MPQLRIEKLTGTPLLAESQTAAPGVYAQLADLIRLQYKARGFNFLPRQPVHSLLAGRRASRLRGRGLDFEEIRRYLPGDDVRNIDWKVTARARKPHVRVYTEERDRPVLLVVDQRVSMFFGSQRAMKSVVAAEVAAIGAWRVLDAGDRVGAIVFNDSQLQEIRPQRRQQTVLSILHELLRFNHQLKAGTAMASNSEMLNETLRKAARLAKHDFLVTIISDFAGANDDTRQIMTSLSQHNDVLAIFVYDPLEQQFPDAGPLVVSDGERQLEWNTSHTATRNEFQRVFDDRVRHAKERLQKREIPLLPLSTSEDVVLQVQRHLGYATRK